MDDIDRYNKIFSSVLKVDLENLHNLNKKNLPLWDSLTHMKLIVTIEDTFGINFDRQDILNFNSYKTGLQILRRKKYKLLEKEYNADDNS